MASVFHLRANHQPRLQICSLTRNPQHVVRRTGGAATSPQSESRDARRGGGATTTDGLGIGSCRSWYPEQLTLKIIQKSWQTRGTTQLGMSTPDTDVNDSSLGRDSLVADKQHTLRELRRALV